MAFCSRDRPVGRRAGSAGAFRLCKCGSRAEPRRSRPTRCIVDDRVEPLWLSRWPSRSPAGLRPLAGRELAPFFALGSFRRHQEPMSSPEVLWHLPRAVRKHLSSPGPRIMESGTLGYLKHPIPPGPPGPGGRGGCVPCGWSLSVNSRQPQPYPRSILPTSGRCQEGEPGSSPGPELLSWRGGEYPAPQHSSRPATPCSHCVGQRMAGPKKKQESSIFFPHLSSLVLRPALGSQKAGETVWGDKPGQE